MFTTLDKALTAAILGILSIVTLVFHVTLPGFLSADTITGIIAAITPLLVFIVPNKPAP
jgi:hypothetical protein